MRKEMRERLKRAGFHFGTVKEFLDLSDEEAAFIELKLALAERLQKVRNSSGMTQAAVATRLGTSQSRVAKMEAVDKSVSIDLLFRALFALGVPRQVIGRLIASSPRIRAA